MSDSLNILVKALISNTAADLNLQVDKLSEKITKAISVKLKIDPTSLTVINDIMDKIKKATRQTGTNKINIFNEADLKQQGIKYKQGVMKTIEDVEKYLRGAFNGKKFDLGAIVKDSSGSIQSFNANIKSANNQLEKVKFNLAEISKLSKSGVVSTNSGYVLSSSQISKMAVKPEQIFNREKLEAEGRQFFISSSNIVERVKREFKSLGDVDVNFLKNSKQEIIGFIANVTKANGVIEKLKFNMGKIQSGNSIQRGYIFTGENLIDRNAGSNIQKTLDKLQLYENKINKLKSGFTSPVTGIKNAENLAILTAEYNKIKTVIDQVRASNINLSNEQRRNIIQNINSLEIEIAKYKDLQRIMTTTNTRTLSANDISLYQGNMSNRLANLQIGNETVFARPEIQAQMRSLTEEIARFGTVGGRSVREINLQFSQLSTSVRGARAEITRINSAADSVATTFMKDLGKLAIWSAAATLVFAPFRLLRQSISYITDLDNALNEIRIVTGYTQTEVTKLANSYNNLAKEMSVTTKEVASQAADLYRQGLDDSQVKERMKSIIEYAKISSISLEDSNKIVTATANATGESVTKIIDIFALLGRLNCPLVA